MKWLVGNDLNSLGAFIARVKVTGLNANDAKAVQSWATHKVPRFIKKAVAAAVATIADAPTRFAQCTSATHNLRIDRV